MLSIILSLLLTTSGLQITVTAPAGCHPCYVQIDNGDPAIYQFNLAPGDSFGATTHILGSAARVRVWTDQSGKDADADQSIVIPAAHRMYLPLL